MCFRAQIVCADQTSFHVRSTCCCSLAAPSSKYFSAAVNQELLANEDLCIRRSVKTNFEKGESKRLGSARQPKFLDSLVGSQNSTHTTTCLTASLVRLRKPANSACKDDLLHK